MLVKQIDFQIRTVYLVRDRSFKYKRYVNGWE